MAKVRFTGRVFPQAAQVSVQDHPQLMWKDSENDYDLTIDISIQNNIIAIDCDISKFDPNLHFVPVYMRAFVSHERR
jgi:hypothetical protein